MPSTKKSKSKHREREIDEECPSTASLDVDLDESSAGHSVTTPHSKKQSKKAKRRTLDSFVHPSGKASTPTSCCHPRICYLAFAVAAVVVIGFGAYLLLRKMGWLPVADQHKDFQGTVASSQLTLHATPNDCWVVYHKKVYVMTDYASKHPGGSEIITNLCGTDGTNAYEAYHPESLLKSIRGEFIGDLVVANGPIAGGNTAGSTSIIAMSDVTLHDSQDDCWIVYYNQVFDMSEYPMDHPGGAFIIHQLCGTDGTVKYGAIHKQSLLRSVQGELVGVLGAPDSSSANAGTSSGSESTFSSSTATGLAMVEVDSHNTPYSCWVVYYDYVYDMTNYANVHGGGASSITKNCGRDGTSSYEREHDKSLLTSIANIQLGKLLAGSGSTTGSVSTTPPSGNGDSDDPE